MSTKFIIFGHRVHKHFFFFFFVLNGLVVVVTFRQLNGVKRVWEVKDRCNKIEFCYLLLRPVKQAATALLAKKGNEQICISQRSASSYHRFFIFQLGDYTIDSSHFSLVIIP